MVVLIATGVGIFFALNKDKSTVTPLTPNANDEDPSSGFSPGNNTVSSPPTSAATNAPTVTQLYDPPNQEDCAAISSNETITRQGDSDQKDFDMAFDPST